MTDIKLSVCMIVKDEEAVLARCLDCVKTFADEIIIVDTGSSDNTKKIAANYTRNIYDFAWRDDFAAARNFSLEKASGDYLMWLDADDVITPENAQKIKSLVKSADFDMAFLKYAAAFDGDTPTFVYYRERIFRRDKNYAFTGFLHEAIAPRGKIMYSDACVYHKKVRGGDPMRNLKIYQKAIFGGISLDERQKFYYGRELYFNKMYLESIAVLEDFLRGDGWIENKIEAALNISRAYAALGEGEKSVKAALRTFEYAPPRSEACCILGGWFANKNELNSAIYWYKCALSAQNEVEKGGFLNADFCNFIPYLQLCVLYDRLGDREAACRFNELAGSVKPQDKSFLYNREYFKKLGIFRGN